MYYVFIYYVLCSIMSYYVLSLCVCIYIYIHTYVIVCVQHVPASFQPALLPIASSTHPTPSAFAPPRGRVAAPWGGSFRMTSVAGSEVYQMRRMEGILPKTSRSSKVSQKQLSAWRKISELTCRRLPFCFCYSILGSQTMDLRWCAAVGQSSTRRIH